MTGESAVLDSELADRSQQALLREAGMCGHPTRSGRPCRAPWNADTSSCGMGHGLTPEQLSALRRQAALASHAVEAQLGRWAERIDWSTSEGVHDSLAMVAEMLLLKITTPQQAGAFAQLAGVRLRPVAKPEDAPVPLEVHVARFTSEPTP